MIKLPFSKRKVGRTDFDTPKGPHALQSQRGRTQSPVHRESRCPEGVRMERHTCRGKDLLSNSKSHAGRCLGNRAGGEWEGRILVGRNGELQPTPLPFTTQTSEDRELDLNHSRTLQLAYVMGW